MARADADLVADLPDLAVAHPEQAVRRARLVLRGHPDDLRASYARQAIGIVQRDAGRLPTALQTLALARRDAERSGDRNRVAEVCATIGAAQVLHGRADAGLATFAAAIAAARGPARARVRVRHGIVLSILGRDEQAIAELSAAIPACRRTGLAQWEARARMARCMSYLARGAVRSADADAVRAEELFAAVSSGVEAATATHNRGLVAYAAGRLPEALAYFDRAEDGYRAAGVDGLGLAEERCAVLIDAGLATDAFDEAQAALQRSVPATVRAQLQLACAAAALETGRPHLAVSRAIRAERAFRRQARPGWAGQARLLRIAAEAATRTAPGRTIRGSPVDLDGLSAAQARTGRLLAGVSLIDRDPAAARPHLALVAAGPARSPLERAARQLARAHLAALDGRRTAVLRACDAGLDAIAEHQLSFAAPELRALAGHNGRQLSALALRTALATGAPRTLLRTAERIRLAPFLDAPATTANLERHLAALRDVTRRASTADGIVAPARQRELSTLERAVRREQRGLASAQPARRRVDVPAVVAALGPRHLVELVTVDDDLHAVVVAGGRVSRILVGPLAGAAGEIEHARAALRRAVYGRRVDLAAVGTRLQHALLGDAARRLGAAPVIVVPPGLAMAPWALLPALRDTAFSVSASATQWLAAAATRPRANRVAVFVAGPGVAGSDADLAAFARWHPRARVLRGSEATTDRVLAALDGAGLAHIAAHGTFRSDNPLFSSLRMADGPLTGYDLQRLHRAPHRLVLGACHAGAAGEDAGLGLAAVLTGRGAAGLLAPLVEVTDDAAAQVAQVVHERLAHGADLAHAALAARSTLVDSPVACAYVAMGS